MLKNVKQVVQSITSRTTLEKLEKDLFVSDKSICALPSAPKFNPSDKSDNGVLRHGSLFHVVKRMIRILPLMHKLRKDLVYALQSIDQNPENPKETVNAVFLSEFETYARSLGIGAVGYTALPHEAIFRGKAVLYEHVIVVTMEMDRDKINSAPSDATMQMFLDVYYRLGRSINMLVDYLRDHGYAAMGGHPLGGQALYPFIAEKAGIGWHGRHGLIITPQFGPRQRLGAIYCSIKNLPIALRNEHAWIGGFCAVCGQCIQTCPAEAIHSTPIMRESNIMTHINFNRCFPYFNEHYCCAVCVKLRNARSQKSSTVLSKRRF
jgi:ferredoxin